MTPAEKQAALRDKLINIEASKQLGSISWQDVNQAINNMSQGDKDKIASLLASDNHGAGSILEANVKAILLGKATTKVDNHMTNGTFPLAFILRVLDFE